jgi:hypothetical protein
MGQLIHSVKGLGTVCICSCIAALSQTFFPFHIGATEAMDITVYLDFSSSALSGRFECLKYIVVEFQAGSLESFSYSKEFLESSMES